MFHGTSAENYCRVISSPTSNVAYFSHLLGGSSFTCFMVGAVQLSEKLQAHFKD
jgi:hypothetical protein